MKSFIQLKWSGIAVFIFFTESYTRVHGLVGSAPTQSYRFTPKFVLLRKIACPYMNILLIFLPMI